MAREDSPADRDELQRVTWAGLVINVALSIAKFWVGWWGHSHALMADAVHSASDIATDVAVLVGDFFWSKPADANHPHGHRQLETFVTFLIGGTLVAVAFGMGAGAVQTLRSGEVSQPSLLAMSVAILSVVIKEALYRWTVTVGRRIDSGPMIANAWHHRSDALSSIPAAIAVGAAAMGPRWAFLDRVGVLAVCAILLHAAYRIAWPALQKLLDTGAPDKDLEMIRRIALSQPGVSDVHKIRTRYVGCSRLAVDLHILVDGEMTVSKGHDISGQVKSLLISCHPQIEDVIVHLEPLKNGP